MVESISNKMGKKATIQESEQEILTTAIEIVRVNSKTKNYYQALLEGVKYISSHSKKLGTLNFFLAEIRRQFDKFFSDNYSFEFLDTDLSNTNNPVLIFNFLNDIRTKCNIENVSFLVNEILKFIPDYKDKIKFTEYCLDNLALNMDERASIYSFLALLIRRDIFVSGEPINESASQEIVKYLVRKISEEKDDLLKEHCAILPKLYSLGYSLGSQQLVKLITAKLISLLQEKVSGSLAQVNSIVMYFVFFQRIANINRNRIPQMVDDLFKQTIQLLLKEESGREFADKIRVQIRRGILAGMKFDGSAFINSLDATKQLSSAGAIKTGLETIVTKGATAVNRHTANSTFGNTDKL